MIKVKEVCKQRLSQPYPRVKVSLVSGKIVASIYENAKAPVKKVIVGSEDWCSGRFDKYVSRILGEGAKLLLTYQSTLFTEMLKCYRPAFLLTSTLRELVQQDKKFATVMYRTLDARGLYAHTDILKAKSVGRKKQSNGRP